MEQSTERNAGPFSRIASFLDRHSGRFNSPHAP